MHYGTLLAGLVVAVAAGAGTAAAGPNVALSSDGASFAAASSFINYEMYGLTTINGGQATAEANLLTTTPTEWLSDLDTRYLFNDQDEEESVTIKLGSEQSLQSFGATWFTALYHDRAPTFFAVQVSTDGIHFTFEGENISLPYGGGEDLLSLATPIDALYVEYEFGGSGSGIDEVFADVPEPAAAALLVTGIASLTVIRRRRAARTA